jgi:uncharacterized protein (DUF1778 family)
MTENAKEPIMDYDIWVLSERDSLAFVEKLLNPPEPNDALKQAAARYRSRRSPD